MDEESEVEFVHGDGVEMVHCIVYRDSSERVHWDVAMCGETPPPGQINWQVWKPEDGPLLVRNFCLDCVAQLAYDTARIRSHS